MRNWCLLLPSLVVGCGNDKSEPDGARGVHNASSGLSSAGNIVTEAEYINPSGRRFVRVSDDFAGRVRNDKGWGDYSDQPAEVQAALATHVATGIAGRAPEQLSDTELAEALRPFALVNGRAYLAVDVDVQAVKAARALDGQTAKLADGFSPTGKVDTFFAKGCCGTDDRWAVGGNTAWPYATIIATFIPCNSASSQWGDGVGCAGGSNVNTRECTWQLIGHSTATAVAHCFYNTFNDTWLLNHRWGAAPDAADSTNFPIPAGYPTEYYNVTHYVPLGWVSSNDDFNYDYAVLDFTSWATPNPGYVAGWMGWGVVSSSDILASKYQLWGVPKVAFDEFTLKTPWPRIWGTTAIRYPGAVGTRNIDFPGDCSGGNSGSALWQWIDAWNGWYMTGSDSRYNSNGTACRARRLESTYVAFIQSSAVEY